MEPTSRRRFLNHPINRSRNRALCQRNLPMPADQASTTKKSTKLATSQPAAKRAREHRSDEGANILPNAENFVSLVRKVARPGLLVDLLERASASSPPSKSLHPSTTSPSIAIPPPIPTTPVRRCASRRAATQAFSTWNASRKPWPRASASIAGSSKFALIATASRVRRPRCADHHSTRPWSRLRVGIF